jgi:serine/threonine protein kinase
LVFEIFIYLRKKNDRRSMAGTYEYLCPEMISRIAHNYKVDNWCLGVLLYEMVVGNSPFKADDVNVIYGKINQVNYEIPKTVKKGCRDLISKVKIIEI